jgi:hypothetical protein
MPVPLDRFLRHNTGLSRKAALGRVFQVTRETWALSSDPRKVRPQVEAVATRKTASEAADFAREAAEAYPRHGFHKPSRAWWAAEEAWFHRFVVHVARKRGGASLALLVASGLVGLIAFAGARRRRAKTED